MKRVLFILATFVISGFAQTFFGSLVGTVTDDTGTSVPNATVNVINAGTSERRTAHTDGLGNYQFVNLVPGVYRIEVEKEGFRRLTRDQIQDQGPGHCSSGRLDASRRSQSDHRSYCVCRFAPDRAGEPQSGRRRPNCPGHGAERTKRPEPGRTGSGRRAARLLQR